MNFFEYVRGLGPIAARHVTEAAQPILSERPQSRPAKPVQAKVERASGKSVNEYVREGHFPSSEPPLPARREGLSFMDQVRGIFCPAPPAPPARDPDLLEPEEAAQFCRDEATRLGFCWALPSGLRPVTDPQSSMYHPWLTRVVIYGDDGGVFYSKKSIIAVVADKVQRGTLPPVKPEPAMAESTAASESAALLASLRAAPPVTHPAEEIRRRFVESFVAPIHAKH